MARQFRVTASPDLQEAGDPAIHYASYIWARPYIMLVPEHCMVLDDGGGTAVGYILGVPDTTSFVADYRSRYLAHLRSQGHVSPAEMAENEQASHDLADAMARSIWNPEQMLHANFPNLLAQYPAHLHIDILPAYQNQGWGKRMLEKLLGRFQDLGVSGVHLGKAGSNVRAGQFYARLGFVPFSEVMDGGKSGDVGRASDGGLYLIKALHRK